MIQAVRFFILRKKTHKDRVQIYKYFFLLESLYNYLYLGLLLQDTNCKFILLECTEKKIYVLRKKTHNERR